MSGNTNFPTSLDSHTSASPLGFGEVTNQAHTKTTTSHTDSVTTLTVADTTDFPTKGYVVVKSELISYTGKTSTTLTGCTRAVGGTTADAYLSGTVVEHVIVAANHNDLAAGLVAVETKVGITSSTPTANKVLGADGTGTSSWRQVATGDIAANAVSQVGAAVGSSVSPTTTGTSYSDVTDMSVTLTTTGGDLLVWFECVFNIDSSSKASAIALSLDGAAETAVRNFQQDNGVTYTTLVIIHRFTGVSAASHTVKARWLTTSPATLTAYFRQRSLTVLELKR